MGEWKEFDIDEFVRSLNIIRANPNLGAVAIYSAELFNKIDMFYKDQLTSLSGENNDTGRQGKSDGEADAPPVRHT